MKFIFRRNFFIVTLFLSFSIFAQAQKQMTEDIYTHSKLSTYDLRDKSLKGSMYIEDESLMASVTGNAALYGMRYNAYYDEMEYEKDGKAFVLPKVFGYDVHFKLSGKMYKVYSYTVKKKKDNGFFVLLLKGDKISLLKKEMIKFFEEEKAKTGYDKYVPPTLKRVKDKLYIGYKNNTTKELPTKKKEILALFSSKSKEVEKYAKSERLGFKKTEDLVELFQYYNSL